MIENSSRISGPSSAPALQAPVPPSSREDFARTLEATGIRFTHHAQSRLISQQMDLSNAELTRLKNGMEKAAQKGASDSLLLMDDKAFIVNVKEKIVITSISQARLRENIFTNIDSAVII